MRYVKDMPSAEFRKTYPRLVEPVAVTVLGRVIGHYVPVGTAIDDRFVAKMRPGEPASWDTLAPPGTRIEYDTTPLRDATPEQIARTAPIRSQTERDAILRRINKGG